MRFGSPLYSHLSANLISKRIDPDDLTEIRMGKPIGVCETCSGP